MVVVLLIRIIFFGLIFFMLWQKMPFFCEG